MAISSIGNTAPISNPTLPQSSVADRPSKHLGTVEKQSGTEQQAESKKLSASEMRNQQAKQRNLDILEANKNASLSVTGQPLSLLYQTAIDAINAELAPTLGENAIQRAQEQGLDTSPEATADRIVSLTMGTFGQFQELHPDLTETEQVDSFLELVRSGVDQGFGAAKEILHGLSVLEGSIAENIEKTYDLVHEGLEQFRQLFLEDNVLAEPDETDKSSDQ